MDFVKKASTLQSFWSVDNAVEQFKYIKVRPLAGLELWRLQLHALIEAEGAGVPGPSTRGLSQDSGHWAAADAATASAPKEPQRLPPIDGAAAALRLARELLRASSETLTEAAELAMQGGLPDDEEVALCDILSTTASHVIKTAR